MKLPSIQGCLISWILISLRFTVKDDMIIPISGSIMEVNGLVTPGAMPLITMIFGKPWFGKNYIISVRQDWICLCLVLLTLRWRHNGSGCVSNHQPHECLLNRFIRRRSKKTSKLRVTGFCAGNSPGPVNSPHKWPVTRKMFPFDDVIMMTRFWCLLVFD